MNVIPGYTLSDRIYDGAKTVVYRGLRHRLLRSGTFKDSPGKLAR
jgi:hypothetical protein